MEEPHKADAEAIASGVEQGLRRLLKDDKLIDEYWQRGWKHLSTHATNAGSQWFGKRILTSIVIAVVTSGLVWLVKSGAIK